MTSRITLMFGIIATASALVSGDSQTTATVRIHVTDAYGRGLGPPHVNRFVELKSKKDYASRFNGSEATGIPYGDYVIQVQAGRFKRAEKLQISRSVEFIVLDGPDWILDRAPGNPPPGPAHRVLGIDPQLKPPIWVRVVPLFGAEYTSQTAQVADDGSFSLYSALFPGTYSVSVLDAQGVLFTGVLESDSYSFDIDLVSRSIRKIQRR
jgi:hypothetical protein